jgi:DNA topoisomerase I
VISYSRSYKLDQAIAYLDKALKSSKRWVRADEVNFKESEHPRAGDGKFTSGGGGGSAVGGSSPSKKTIGSETSHGGTPVGAASKLKSYASKEEWPAHIKALKLPPAWTNVRVSDDPKSDIQAVGYDAKGRSQTAKKFARIKTLDRKYEGILNQNSKALTSRDQATREHASVTALIMEMGLRPGSERETGAAEKAFGATTLRSEHVIKSPDGGVVLQFTGKKGVKLSLPVTDPKLADDLVARAKRGGQLFPDVSDISLRDYVGKLGGGGFKTKDFRTLKATRLANSLVEGKMPPRSEAEYKRMVKQVATEVSKVLGNTPTVALQSYISPMVFTSWRSEVDKNAKPKR